MSDCDAPLTLRLLGPLEAEVYGHPLPRLRSRKGEWLLALLALKTGREIERDWLMAVLWPESPEAKAQLSLRVSLKDLRGALGPEAERLTSPTPHSLCLDLAGAEVDVLAFDGFIRRGDEASLEQAVALYRGPLLEGCMEAWVFEERQAREGSYLAAREALAAYAMARGDAAAAERHLRLLVARDPLRESGQRLLIQALAASGHYAAALHAYRELRLLLHRELHAEPDPETRAVFEQIRGEARRRSHPAPARDRMALSRAQELPALAPGPDGAASRPRDDPRRDGTPLHNLPCPLTRFVGRREEIAEVHRLLATERLVTLTGPGGCGKTRLALEVGEACVSRADPLAAAAQQAPEPGPGDPPVERYPDGVWFAELAGLSASDRVPEAVLSALGVPEMADFEAPALLIRYLRQRRLLLILDNCEPHVAVCAGLAEQLLRACPGLRVLATSREALGIAGERLYRVPPLSLPPATEKRELEVGDRIGAGAGPALTKRSATHAPAEWLLEYDAVRLFVDRATAALPAFRLSRQSLLAVAEICRRLEGLPLAIELAAARTKLLSLEQIGAGLEDRFGLLAAGSRTAPPRHRTLRASIDWSHDLLTEPEQILMRRLSVFEGGWSLEAALATCCDSASDQEDPTPGADPSTIQGPRSKIQNQPVLELLGQLVEKSLVVREDRKGRARFRLLESIAEYGREKLERAGETSWMRGQHRDWFLALAERGWDRGWGPERDAWCERAELEAENLRAALAWSLERGEPEAAMRLGTGLALFWGRRYLLSEGREQLARLLSISQGLEPTPTYARLLKEAGWFARTLGHHTEARQRFERSLDLYRRLGDEAAVTVVLSDLAELALYREGNAAAGRAYLEEQISRCRALGDPHATATALTGLSRLAHLAADYRRALELSAAVVRVRREAGPSEALEKGLEALGHLVYDLGDHATALAHFEERLEVLQARAQAQGVDLPPRSAGSRAADRCPGRMIRALSEEYVQVYESVADRGHLAGTLITLGSLVFEQGDFAVARACWEESLSRFRKGGDRANSALVLNNLAELARCRGVYEDARARLEESRQIGEEIGQRRTLADAIYRQGLLASDLGQWEAAEKHLEEGCVHYQELGHRWPLLLTLCHQAIFARRQGDLARARALLDDALPRLRETERQSGIALALAVRGSVLRDEGDLSQARADLLESLALRRPRADRLGMAECLEGLAAVESATLQHAAAARLLRVSAALREAIGAPVPPADQEKYDQRLADIRTALGQGAFSAAWVESQFLSPEQMG